MQRSGKTFFAPVQTNTALYVQLHDSGHPVAAILRVQKAYRLSCKLFSGRYRKSERAFICHSVGAASSLANFDRRIEYVIAAMLHAAYDSGQFPDGRCGGRSESHRKWLAAQIGPEVESIVARYADFEFGEGEPERLVASPPPDGVADLLFMALAHEVDDMADAGLSFAPKYGHSIGSRAEACAILAEQAGHHLLAETFRGLAEFYEGLDWTDELKVTKLEGFSVVPNLRAYWRLRRAHLRGKSVQLL